MRGGLISYIRIPGTEVMISPPVQDARAWSQHRERESSIIYVYQKRESCMQRYSGLLSGAQLVRSIICPQRCSSNPPSPPLPSSHRRSRPPAASYSSINTSHSHSQQNEQTSSSFISAPLNRSPTGKHTIKPPSPSHLSPHPQPFRPLRLLYPPQPPQPPQPFTFPSTGLPLPTIR